MVYVVEQEMLVKTRKQQETLRWLKVLQFSLKQGCPRKALTPAATTNWKNPLLLVRNSGRERSCICVAVLWGYPFVIRTFYKPALSVHPVSQKRGQGPAQLVDCLTCTKLWSGSRSSISYCSWLPS